MASNKITISITSTTTFSSNGLQTTITHIRNADGTTSVTVGGNGEAKQGKAVKSAKATKPISKAKSSPSSVVTLSDQTLASKVSAGTLDKYTINEMKDILSARNLKKCGNKQEMIARLEKYVNEQHHLRYEAQQQQQRQQQEQLRKEMQALQARIQSQQQSSEEQRKAQQQSQQQSQQQAQQRLAQLQAEQKEQVREEEVKAFLAKHSNTEAAEAQRKREEANRGRGWW